MNTSENTPKVVCEIDFFPPVSLSCKRNAPIDLVHTIRADNYTPHSFNVGIALSDGGDHPGLVSSLISVAQQNPESSPHYIPSAPSVFYTNTDIAGTYTSGAYLMRSYPLSPQSSLQLATPPDMSPVFGILIPHSEKSVAQAHPLARLAFCALYQTTADYTQLYEQSSQHGARRLARVAYQGDILRQQTPDELIKAFEIQYC